MSMSDLTPRRLHGTDLEIGPLVLGTMTFGTQIDEAESTRIVHRARELGVTMFDSANSYSQGRSEEILGRAVRPFRDDVQIVTKVGSTRSVADPSASRLDRASILGGCDESLARLGCDYIDLYYLHMPDPRTDIAESLDALQELVDAGKVRNIGMSNYAAWQMADAIHLADRNRWPRARGQPLYNLLARRIEEEYVACTERFGVSNLAYNPLAGGLLTGKHRRGTRPAEGTRFTWLSNYMERYWNNAQFDAVDKLESIAHSAGLSLIELSLRWLLGRPGIAGIILGVSSLDHLETNLAAADGPAPDSDMIEATDDVWRVLRGPAPAYNR